MSGERAADCSYTLQWVAPCPLKIAPSHGMIWILSNTWFVDSTQAHNQKAIWISLAIFAQLTTQESLYFTRVAPSPSKLLLPMGDLDISNIWFLEPTPACSPKGISIGSAVCRAHYCPIDRQTDQPTDHATGSVTISHIYVHSTAMQPNNTMWQSCMKSTF